MESKGERERKGVIMSSPHMQTKERRKDRESLVALLVLMIEFRREEGRELHLCHGMAASPRFLSHSRSHR